MKNIDFRNDRTVINKRIWKVIEELNEIYNFNIYTLSKVLKCSQQELQDLDDFISHSLNYDYGLRSKPDNHKVSVFNKFFLCIRKHFKSVSYKSVSAEFRGLNDNTSNDKNLSNYYPSEALIEKLNQIFGVSKEWLESGEGHPYQYEGYYSYACDLKDFVITERQNINKIHFVLSDSDKPNCSVLFDLKNYKYSCPRTNWNFGSHVGRQGRQQLVSLYNFMKWIKNTGEISTYGSILPKEDYDLLRNAEENARVFFPEYWHNRCKGKYWWDDFTDIHHTFPISKDYFMWYGQKFIDAQQIVKDNLE